MAQNDMVKLSQILAKSEALVSDLVGVQKELRDQIESMQYQFKTEIHQLQQENARLRGDNDSSDTPVTKKHSMLGAGGQSRHRASYQYIRKKDGAVPPPPSMPPPGKSGGGSGNPNKLTAQKGIHSRTRSSPPKEIDLDVPVSGGRNTAHSVSDAARGDVSRSPRESYAPGMSTTEDASSSGPHLTGSSSTSGDPKPIDLLPNGTNHGKISSLSKKKKKRNPQGKGKPANELSEREFYKKYWIEAGKIGEGAFSRVRRITRKDDKKIFALKMIKKRGKTKEDIAALQKEIYVLQQCNHVNIVKLLDWCDTKKRIYMVVEFCDGGDVFERVIQMKKFSEKDAAHVIRQVASGLAHLHENQFVHRDLKPDNLMYLTKAHDSQIKIIDFGLAGDAIDGPCKTPCGTAHYAAPEVLSNQPYNVSADMWSLGVILYTLLCGFPPFFDANNNLKNLYHLIKKAKYAFPSPFWDSISQEAKNLISQCLVKDPQKRITAPQVLVHPWVSGKAASSNALSGKYIQQMQHWQSTRRQTESVIGIGTKTDTPANGNAKPIDLFAPSSP